MIAKPGRDARDLRREEREAAGEQREHEQRPQPVQQRSRSGAARAARCVVLAPASSRAIGGLVALRRPSAQPDHRRDQPPADGDEHERLFGGDAPASTVTTASAVAAPALSSTVVLRKSTNRTRYSSASSSPRTPPGPSTVTSASRASSGGASSEARPRTARPPALPPRRAPRSPRNASRSVVSSPTYIAAATVLAAEQRGDAEALVEGDRRTHLEHLAPPVNGEARSLRLGDLPHGLFGGLLVGGAAPVEGGDRALVLAAHAQPLALGVVRPRREVPHAPCPRRELGVDLRPRRAGAQQLAAVVADVGDRPDRDDLARGRRAAPAHAAHHPVAARDLDQHRARRLGHVRVGGVPDDRRERAVDVEQDRRAIGLGADRPERLHERCGWRHASSMPRMVAGPSARANPGSPRPHARLLRLAVIGTLGRPLQRPLRRGRRDGDRAAADASGSATKSASATATSLAAIALIAAFAAAVGGLYGNVRVGDAALVGVPAVAGVLLGTWLAQRVPGRAIALHVRGRARRQRRGAGAAGDRRDPRSASPAA